MYSLLKPSLKSKDLTTIMARSEESILRRALKRSRTEGQQRQADRNEMKRQALKLSQKAGSDESDINHNNKRLRVSDQQSRSNQEEGKSDKINERSQSVRKDRDNTELRNHHRLGSSEMGRKHFTRTRTPQSTNRVKKSRHDEVTSKKLVWARQADSKKLSKNQEVRQRYRETGGEGMDSQDLERAKLLIARDKRKQEKKNKRMSKIDSAKTSTEAQITTGGSTVEEGSPQKEGNPRPDEPSQGKPENNTSPGNNTSPSNKKDKRASQAKRDQNKALRLRYLETNGKGMKENQIERAKLLIARDEKKQKRRAQQKQQAGK